MSVSLLVSNKLSRMRKGVPFPIENFYSLGSLTSVQKAFSRLTKEERVVRVAKGIYSRPKPLTHMPSIKVTATAKDVAKTWARSHNYKLVKQSIEEAYRLGLHTQAPVKTVFWTTGPSRQFSIGNETVIVQNKAPNKLRWENKPEGRFYRGLLSLSHEHTTAEALKVALHRMNLNKAQSCNVVKKMIHSHVLTMWESKLKQLEKII